MPARPPRSAQRPRPGRARRPDEAQGGQTGDGEMIRDIVLDLVAKQQALSALIDRCLAEDAGGAGAVAAGGLARLMALHSQNAARLGRLLRDKRALADDDGDGINPAIARALDALSKQWDIDL